jgi:hypothetical protein
LQKDLYRARGFGQAKRAQDADCFAPKAAS